MTAYRLSSCYLQGVYPCHYLALFTPIMERILKVYTAVLVLNDTSITYLAALTAGINMETESFF